jgi:hypothetical protein
MQARFDMAVTVLLLSKASLERAETNEQACYVPVLCVCSRVCVRACVLVRLRACVRAFASTCVRKQPSCTRTAGWVTLVPDRRAPRSPSGANMVLSRAWSSCGKL